MNNTFEQEWEQLSQRYSQSRCPKSDAALDQAIDSVVSGIVKPRSAQHHIRPIWYGVIAAACLSGAIVPVALSQRADDAPLVEVGGSKVYFKCNNGCSATNTIETFNTLIK